MKKKNKKRDVTFEFVLFTCGAITLLMLPRISFESLSLPKSLFLYSAVSILLLRFVIQTRVLIFTTKFERLIILTIFFIFVNISVNHESLTERLFGITLRNNGALSLISLLLLAFFTFRHGNIQNLRYFWIALFATKLVLEIYTLSEILDVSPKFFVNIYDAPTGTLGNPNLVSAFIGLASISNFIFYHYVNNAYSRIIILFSAYSIDLYFISSTSSIQGFIVLMTPLLILFYWKIYSRLSSTKFSSLSLVSAVAMGLLAFLALIGKGPFGGALYSETFDSRVNYWKSGISMGMSRPLFGVGFDRYGDYFREFRTQETLEKFGQDQITDTAHNYFIDLFAWGGLSLIVCMLILFLRPLLSLKQIDLVQTNSKLDSKLLIPFMLSSILGISVSITSISLLSWVFVGIGFIWKLSNVEPSSIDTHQIRKYKNWTFANKRKSTAHIQTSWKKISNLTSKAALIFYCFFVFLGCWKYLVSDIQLLEAVQRGDGREIEKLVMKFPHDSRRVSFAARGFETSGNTSKALELARVAVKLNSRDFESWKFIALNTKDSAEKSSALMAIRNLDPRYSLSGG